MLKEPAWSLLTSDRKMFLQSFPDQDVLGQAFEDALEVLQQHSDREMQYSPGKKDQYSIYIIATLYFYKKVHLETLKWDSNFPEVD